MSRVVPSGEVFAEAYAVASEIVEDTSAVAVAAARHLLGPGDSSGVPRWPEPPEDVVPLS